MLYIKGSTLTKLLTKENYPHYLPPPHHHHRPMNPLHCHPPPSHPMTRPILPTRDDSWNRGRWSATRPTCGHPGNRSRTRSGSDAPPRSGPRTCTASRSSQRDWRSCGLAERRFRLPLEMGRRRGQKRSSWRWMDRPSQ